MYMINIVQLHVAAFLVPCCDVLYGRDCLPKYTQIYPNTPKYTQIHPKNTQIHHKIVFIVLVKGSI